MTVSHACQKEILKDVQVRIFPFHKTDRIEELRAFWGEGEEEETSTI